MVVVLCEYEFETESSEKKGYAQLEIDIYSTPEFRYSMRKNLQTGNYEFYRFYWRNKTEEVQYTYSDFISALRTLSREIQKQYHDDSIEYIFCDHTFLSCPKNKKQK